MLRTLILTALTFSFIASGSRAFAADPSANVKVRIAAAADLRYAMDEIGRAFEKTHPGVKLDIVYGSSGQFTQQIMVGAPYDLFLSADSTYPAMLKEKKKVVGDDFQYGSGRLVLWTSNATGIKLDEKKGIANILDPKVKKIAIANPDHAPYGRAVQALLKKAGLYDKIKSELVLGENIAQAAQFAQSKAAQVGLIAYALALSPEMKKEGNFILLTDAAPLRQSGVILAASEDMKNAQDVRDYIMSKAGQETLATFGFKKE